MTGDNILDSSSQRKYEPTSDQHMGLSGYMHDSVQEDMDENMVDSVTAPLVLRPKTTQSAGVADVNGESSDDKFYIESKFSEDKPCSDGEPSDDEHGFTLVSSPKPVTPDEPMSSPELISTPIIDILKAIGSDYSDDDDWTML
jgi:hypothetical protein